MLATDRFALAADDYSVDFAVESKVGSRSGSVYCQFDNSCQVTVDAPRLNFAILVRRHFSDSAHLMVDQRYDGCCLFEGAAWRITIDTRSRTLAMRIFAGYRAKGLEFIPNEPVGNLYLKFHFRGDHKPSEDGDFRRSSQRL
jgi:hypothetical protein